MLMFLLLFVFWAVVHSITASPRFKAAARIRVGERAYLGMYRLIYNVLSALTILPVLIVGALAIPHDILWKIGSPLNLLFLGIQLLGLIGLGVSLLQTDVLRFLGISQFLRYLRGEPEVDQKPVLVTSGTYRVVRHPLYFFSLLLIWFTPIMTLSMLLFNLVATAYFWIGSGYEEKRLAAAFGDRYEAYRKRVPRLIPIKIR
jgi:protein-S-isoprenylcysteine O-methyltransferase Ste14